MNISRTKRLAVAGVLLLSLIAAFGAITSPARGDAPVARHDPDPDSKQKPQRVVFVVDSSENLAGRIGSLQAQLIQAIDALDADQRLGVFTYSGSKFVALNSQLKEATPEFKANAKRLIHEMKPEGGCDPNPAMELACKYKPDLIYFIVGGDFKYKDRIVERMKAYSAAHPVRINTILFYNQPPPADLTKTLETLASQGGGVFRKVDSTKLPPDPTTGPTTAP